MLRPAGPLAVTLYTCIDKISGQSMSIFYANTSIKKGGGLAIAEPGRRSASSSLPLFPHNWVSHVAGSDFRLPQKWRTVGRSVIVGKRLIRVYGMEWKRRVDPPGPKSTLLEEPR